MSHKKVSDAQFSLGKVIPPDAHYLRDAIHIAVMPVVLGEMLFSGAMVKLEDGFARSANPNDAIGIIDPFLGPGIGYDKGTRVWLFILPNTISSLRHVWEHPAIVDEEEKPQPPSSEKAASEKWMRQWAMEHMGEDYYREGDKLSEEEAYALAIKAGHTLSVGPYESARDEIDALWWTHWENITGLKGDREAYFSCGC